MAEALNSLNQELRQPPSSGYSAIASALSLPPKEMNYQESKAPSLDTEYKRNDAQTTPASQLIGALSNTIAHYGSLSTMMQNNVEGSISGPIITKVDKAFRLASSTEQKEDIKKELKNFCLRLMKESKHGDIYSLIFNIQQIVSTHCSEHRNVSLSFYPKPAPTYDRDDLLIRAAALCGALEAEKKERSFFDRDRSLTTNDGQKIPAKEMKRTYLLKLIEYLNDHSCQNPVEIAMAGTRAEYQEMGVEPTLVERIEKMIFDGRTEKLVEDVRKSLVSETESALKIG